MMSSSNNEQFYNSALNGQLSTVKTTMRDPTLDLNWKNPHGFTALAAACSKDHFDVVEYLLTLPKVDVNLTQQDGLSPLSIAVMRNYQRIVKLLLQDSRTDLKSAQKEGKTALFLACHLNQKDIVAMLLEDPRVDVNQATETRVTPFFAACQSNSGNICLLMLADSRVDVRHASAFGATPLWIATFGGHTRIVQQLLASGRDVAIKRKTYPGRDVHNRKTAAELAKLLSTKLQGDREGDEEFSRRKFNAPIICTLLEGFERDPVKSRQQLRNNMNVQGETPPPLLRTGCCF